MNANFTNDAKELTEAERARYRRSVSLTINLSALRRNLIIARRLSGGSRQFATIKADAYGHGAVAIAHALSTVDSERRGDELVGNTRKSTDAIADGFAVVTLDEALELRYSGIKQAILVLQGPQTPDACLDMLQYDLWPVIHDMQQYDWYRKHQQRGQLSAWLKVDTGMGRLGVQVAEANNILKANDGVQWKGLMTHFACADDPENPFTTQQLEKFGAVSNSFGLDKSMANSAAILAWPQTRADWARPGVMLYGCNPFEGEIPNGVALEPVMTVTAPLISVKSLSADAGVGYAQAWHCPENMPIGYVALGYGDGLPRILDKSAAVTINGKRCPIVGRVSMDSIAVDLRQVPDVALGAVVEFWGGNSPINLLAKAAGTINYELLTSIRGCRSYVTKL